VALRKWDITGIEPKKGDTVRYYVRHEPLTTDTKVSRDARLLREYDGDEDTEYYLDRLDTTADLFRPFFDHPEVVFDQSSDQHGLFGGPDYTKMSIRRTQVNETPGDSDI
jgi:DNA polymerase elongation subunit (family B)